VAALSIFDAHTIVVTGDETPIQYEIIINSFIHLFIYYYTTGILKHTENIKAHRN